MRINYLLGGLLLAAIPFIFTGCGDDEKPRIPKLKKITQITCTQEDGTSTLWNMNISYTKEGNLEKVVYQSQDKVTIPEVPAYTDLYQYKSGSISVIRTVGSDAGWYKEYTRSGDVITAETELLPLGDNIYRYAYKNSYLREMSRTIVNSNVTIPYVYTWENGNLKDFTYNNITRLNFEYDNIVIIPQPYNFPLRAIKSVNVLDKNFLDPVNLMFNVNNHSLPKSATEVDVLTNKTIAEYTFDYGTIGEYITSMSIAVIYNSGDKTPATYKYSFTYNFDPNNLTQ